MNGLLDFIKTPEGQGLLTAAFGGLAGLTGYSNAIEAQNQQAQQAQMDELRKMQVEQARMGMDKARADAAKLQAQEAWRSKLPSLMQPRLYGTDAASQQVADQNAEFGDFGAQMAATLRQPAGIGYGADQNALQAHLMDPNSPFADELVKRQLFPKQDEPFTLSEGQVRYGPGGKVIASAAPKAADLPSDVRSYQFAQNQGFKGSFQDWILSQKKASAPSVAVNMSDPTAVAKAALSFQKDYRDATKSSFARSTAYNAMMEASKNPSPKGDMTMVYSFIKALDPESVVREGEIGLVNSNRSIPDQIKGYAQKLANGQSLLPSERKDLIEQARTLSFTDYSRSRNDIKAFRDNASRLGLDPEL